MPALAGSATAHGFRSSAGMLVGPGGAKTDVSPQPPARTVGDDAPGGGVRADGGDPAVLMLLSGWVALEPSGGAADGRG